MPYTDKTLSCQDCSQEFAFSADDQEFFASKGYTDPKRCPDCRRARKAERGGLNVKTLGGPADSKEGRDVSRGRAALPTSWGSTLQAFISRVEVG